VDFKGAEKKIDEIIKETNKQSVLKKIVEYLYNNFKHYSWIGIYLVDGNDLVLGPWKGPNATEHTRIPIGTGICGAAAASGKTEIIVDVHSDNRYLSCFFSTKSEIVIPIKKEGTIVGEIDIDSDKIGSFSNDDKLFLERVAKKLSRFM